MPSAFIRGGTSKEVFINRKYLPRESERMGSDLPRNPWFVRPHLQMLTKRDGGWYFQPKQNRSRWTSEKCNRVDYKYAFVQLGVVWLETLETSRR